MALFWNHVARIARNTVKFRFRHTCMVVARMAIACFLSFLAGSGDSFGKPHGNALADKPNVITIFIDDMGWSDLSCFGGKQTTTENIDRLASEGIRFTQFYVNSPICSPSRVALSTGQYPHRHRITSYLDNRKRNKERGVAQWLDPGAPMIAREFQRAGYATGHFGKWHMGGQRDVGDAPLISAYGFDRSLTNFEGLGPRVLPLTNAGDGKPPGKHDLGSALLENGPIRWEDRSRITTAFVNEAMTFIDLARASEQPFFINLWPDDVHSPFFPPTELRAGTDGSKRQLYAAVLDSMDQQLGRLFDKIRNDPVLRENTLILLMSDNGNEEGAGSCEPLRGGKTWLYEGGIRSPLIVWGPGLLDQNMIGRSNDSAVLCALDINRSLYSIADVAVPKTEQPLDGEDVSSSLLGKSSSGRQSPIFWRRPPDRPGRASEDNPDLAVRRGQWKYLVNYDGSDPQLYDLAADPVESHNQVKEKPEIVQQLHAALTAWNSTLPRDAGDPEWEGHATSGSLSSDKFVNPIGEGADPWVVRDPNARRYLWCMSDGNRGIAIHTSNSVTSLGQKYVIWTAPDSGPVSKEVWAPELHYLDDRWYIYFAASDGRNENHLAYVLQSKTNDPLGDYELHGPLATGDGADGKSPNIWAIDMTVLQLSGKRYAVWSGWDQPGSDQQYLYIAPMKSPVELAGPRVRLCDNDDYLWERVEPEESKRGLHEGPQIFQANGSTAIVYSCGASWLPTYKLGLLELAGEDPVLPSSWQKRAKPIFESTESTYGVGHSCFVKSLDDQEWWHVFHAKRDRDPGWRRSVFVQPMRVGQRGFPVFEKPVAPGTMMDRPSGDTPDNAEFSPKHFDFFGHHQFLVNRPDEIRLGRVPEHPINDYRSGEKVIFHGTVPRDFKLQAEIDFHGNSRARDTGLLFRTTAPSIGYDSQRGYFAGLIPSTQLVILGRTDGSKWLELARAATSIDPEQRHQLMVQVQGSTITVLHNGEQKIQHSDSTWTDGKVGLRVVDTDASFSSVSVEAVPVR